jgi:SAM-dependent methyltransferase
MSNDEYINDSVNVDWEKAWQNELGSKRKEKKHWTKSTPKIHFEKIAIKDEYHEKLIPKLILDKNDKVLDLGCGEGAVTTLIAEKVNKVTGLDSSKMMLDLLKQRCEHDNINNIDIVNMRIEDATVDSVGIHDVVIASRSFIGIYDLEEVINNIQRIAKKYVFLIVFGRRNWPLEKKFFKSIGKKYPDFPPYDYLFNLLVNLNIYPNIENFDLVGNRKYDDMDDAYIRMKWKMDLLTDEEKKKIKPFLEENLFKNEEVES